MLKAGIARTAILAVVAVAAPTSTVRAQPGYWEFPTDNWPSSRCIVVSNLVVPLECGDMNMFLTARTPIAGQIKCCSKLDFQSAETVALGADCKFKLCGAEWTVKIDGSHTFTTNDLFDRHVPCGCVQVYWEQQFRVRKMRKAYRRCINNYVYPNSFQTWDTWTEERILKDKVPYVPLRRC